MGLAPQPSYGAALLAANWAYAAHTLYSLQNFLLE